ncbi:hypothetical protein UFOVP1349_49 [uncultured Caudovirales phage]|uniref:Uncharacterized protein n=1 Tax=uncultured Caudovirales phage TaxID=2100421 RepID=A0A6J5S4B0_9CAUD|nr:hypothetical protein UFOVP925_51 [uncultured Caudovirales phage]CAB4184347.1 hypothetical protein UFOVP1097_55 [uncultured Caudovirales phage]CAB4200499.1 hypothetical protein UFOVP1349_49 [uncultured Caudovirales phage]CAB4214314.1 hypothetical protein UFOVP1456_29 [uncultured Caudovirales phage]
MANQFDVQVPNVLQSLMAGEQSFKEARGNRMQNDQMAARQEAAQIMQGGGDPKSAIARLLGAGLVQDASTVANMGNNQRDFLFREQESRQAQDNADRSYGLQKTQMDATLEGNRVPAGFAKTPTGLQPIPNGPEDPDYLRRRSEATDKGRQMSVTDITKLSDEGQKFADLGRFSTTFKPEFSGYGSNAVGAMANVIGRNAPEGVARMIGKDIPEAATWWQGYDRYKNVVRNELYGAALTKPEQAAFDSADIQPGMQSHQIEKNLALQQQIVTNGLKRKASAMVNAGYDPKTIGSAYGVDLGQIGVNAQGRRGAVAPAPSGAPVKVNSPAERDALQPGTPYIAPNGSLRTKQ